MPLRSRGKVLGGRPQLRERPPGAWPGSPLGFRSLGFWAFPPGPGAWGGGVLKTPSLAFPRPRSTPTLFLSWPCGGGALEAPCLALYLPAFTTPWLALHGLLPGPVGLFPLAPRGLGHPLPLDLRRSCIPGGGLVRRTKGPLHPREAPSPALPSSRPPGGKGQEEKKDEEVGQEEPPGKGGRLQAHPPGLGPKPLLPVGQGGGVGQAHPVDLHQGPAGEEAGGEKKGQGRGQGEARVEEAQKGEAQGEKEPVAPGQPPGVAEVEAGLHKAIMGRKGPGRSPPA